MLDESLGGVIRIRREGLGLRVADVARHLGITEAAYRRYERGERHLRPGVLARTAALLGTEPGRLFDEAIMSADGINDGASALRIDGQKLASLVGDDATRPAFRIDLSDLMRSLERAVNLILRLQSGELVSARFMLASDLRAEFTRVVRFVLSSSEQLSTEERTSIVEALQAVIGSRDEDGLSDRAARAHAAYLAGACGWPHGRRVVEEAWVAEKDPWVKRSMVRGLAKAGLRHDIAAAHERDLRDDAEVQRVDLGFWTFYSGDCRRLDEALRGPPWDMRCPKTVNALLHNLLTRASRDDRRFDLRTMALLLGHARRGSVSRQQAKLLEIIVSEPPPENEAEAAWRYLCDEAEAQMGIRPLARRS